MSLAAIFVDRVLCTESSVQISHAFVSKQEDDLH